MNIPNFKKDILVPLCVSVAGCAIWAGIVWGKDHVAGINAPHLGGFDVFQFGYIAVIAFVGYFFGKRSRNAELSEIYADVILFWLKENCHTVCTFTTESMAAKVALPNEKTSLGLQRLLKHELIVKKRLFWEYSAASASNVSPGYERLVGQETAARKRENGLQEVIATQEQTIRQLKVAFDPLRLSGALSALPVYAQDIEIKILCIARGGAYLDFGTETLFIQLKIFSPEDAGIRSFKICLLTEGGRHEGDTINDLSDWFLVKERKVQTPYSNTLEFTNMDEVSLWREIQAHGLKSGIHAEGWVAIQLDERYRDIVQGLKRIKLSLDRVGTANLYRFTFGEWLECKHEILNRKMKENRFGA
ncbi:MAG: hypothetical protein WCA76_04110 [Candidatus Sulfotelmatobacter sp.]|jgi:hypothetical protein